MLYNLLGRTVWYGAKLFLHRKVRSSNVPKSLLAGATVAVGAGVTMVVLRALSDHS
jgi:hypothetical protein